jgi:hypothetical protein
MTGRDSPARFRARFAQIVNAPKRHRNDTPRHAVEFREPERSAVMAKRRQKSTARRGKLRKPSRRWSARVTRESDALDLKKGVFSKRSPKAIALSLKRPAERSRRRSSAHRRAVTLASATRQNATKFKPALTAWEYSHCRRSSSQLGGETVQFCVATFTG